MIAECGIKRPQLLEIENIQAKLGHYMVKIRQVLEVEGYMMLEHIPTYLVKLKEYTLSHRIVEGV